MDKIAVTIREATTLSGLGKTTIFKLLRTGKLTRRKAGRKSLILLAELRDYLGDLPTGGRADAE